MSSGGKRMLFWEKGNPRCGPVWSNQTERVGQ